MRILTSAFIALFISTTFLACKKESDKPATPNAVAGVYSGKYGLGSEDPDNNYTLNLKAGGTIEELGMSSGNPVARGTWVLNGTTLTAKYTMLYSPFNNYFLVAAFDASSGTFTGTWGYENSSTDGGKFQVSRK
jgi:hypothetical protein